MMIGVFFESIVYGFGAGLLVWLLAWGIRQVINLLRSSVR